MNVNMLTWIPLTDRWLFAVTLLVVPLCPPAWPPTSMGSSKYFSTITFTTWLVGFPVIEGKYTFISPTPVSTRSLFQSNECISGSHHPCYNFIGLLTMNGGKMTRLAVSSSISEIEIGGNKLVKETICLLGESWRYKWNGVDYLL